MLSRKELLSQTYLNQTQIRRLLKISQYGAQKVFRIAWQIDRDQLRERLIYTNKVRLKTVLKVAGIDYSLLERQVREDDKKDLL